MKDFIPKGTGNSRLMKSSIPTGTTWEEALAMLRAGTFPFDLNGINAVGVAQMGDALNVANLLPNAVGALYGLGAEAVLRDILEKLASSILLFSESIKLPNGTDVKDSLVSILGCAKISTGSYIGNNGSGPSRPSSLTFEFPPKIVIISGGSEGSGIKPVLIVLINGASFGISLFYNGTIYANSNTTANAVFACVSQTFSGNTVSYYAPIPASQGNISPLTYRYIAAA